MAAGRIALGVYLQYFSAASPWLCALVLLATLLMEVTLTLTIALTLILTLTLTLTLTLSPASLAAPPQATADGMSIWYGYWAEHADALSARKFLLLTGAIAGANVLCALLRAFLFAYGGLRAAR